ncbi:methyl-accepting chemotaxis protein [Methylorubrum extorquens]|uniref:methyl-accepting chemotaxis protein n=1 Tax=Methylorubrum extorquens TaxID=408 RepID=UPI003F61A933
MFSLKQARDVAAKLNALDRVQAVIEFDLAGTILTANPNFLAAVGYELHEIVGRHHSLFVDPAYGASAEYESFWNRLRAGEFQAAQFMRLTKSGCEIWIEASYNPMLGRDGKPYKIVKFATDITERKREDALQAGRLAAIDKSQAVIAFSLDGTVVEANGNFLKAMGYTADEIVGRHHHQFVDAATAGSAEYSSFWEQLRAGVFQAGQFKRLAKGGREVWIEASYNPILDAAGRPYQVVKYATDITAQVALLSDLRRLIDRNFGEIDAAVSRSDHQAAEAARAVEASGASVQAMAAAAEEMSASIASIAAAMNGAISATEHARDQVASAGEQTECLTKAAAAMGGIVGIIQSIASQINLLALNATIEAARAGAAGRGFAVVASEVKALAAKAACATDQIQSEIAGVQQATAQVVEALSAIQGSTAMMRGTVADAAAAADQQSMATHELSVHMQETACAVAGITGNVAAITAAVAAVSGAVATTKDAARVLVR